MGDSHEIGDVGSIQDLRRLISSTREGGALKVLGTEYVCLAAFPR